MNRVEKCMVAARRVWGFIWKECTGFRAHYYSWHCQMPCVHIITTLNLGFFLPIFFTLFHHLLHKNIFSCAEEEAVLLKRKPVVVGGPTWWWVTSYQRLHCLGGRCSSAAPCGGLVVCDRCVCDPRLWVFFFSFFVLLFYRRQTSQRIMAICFGFRVV